MTTILCSAYLIDWSQSYGQLINSNANTIDNTIDYWQVDKW